MAREEIPKAILKKHPELAQIEEALVAYQKGRQITARCPGCGKALAITEIPATGELWVTCSSGCTTFRVRRQK